MRRATGGGHPRAAQGAKPQALASLLIPILVITGPLGAGKTTLLRRLLDTPGARLAAVVNDFAALGIDQMLLGGDTIASLSNGCFCCRDQGDIALALNGLFAARRAGRIGDFDRVVIETSGLADPGAILLALAADRDLGRLFSVDRVLVCVDATRRDLLTDDVIARQLALADVVAITKPDLAGAEHAAMVESMVAVANPSAAIHLVRSGEFPLGEILAVQGRRARFVADAPVSHGAILRCDIVCDEDWAWEPFSLAMQLLGELRGPDVLRVKGILRIIGRERPVVYHRVQHLAHPTSELAAWPDGVRQTRLVIIARALDDGAIRALIDAAQAVAG